MKRKMKKTTKKMRTMTIWSSAQRSTNPHHAVHRRPCVNRDLSSRAMNAKNVDRIAVARNPDRRSPVLPHLALNSPGEKTEIEGVHAARDAARIIVRRMDAEDPTMVARVALKVAVRHRQTSDMKVAENHGLNVRRNPPAVVPPPLPAAAAMILTGRNSMNGSGTITVPPERPRRRQHILTPT